MDLHVLKYCSNISASIFIDENNYDYGLIYFPLKPSIVKLLIASGNKGSYEFIDWF